MQTWICITCGTQYPASEQPPEGCPCCLDERQYVRQTGQEWITWEQLQNSGRHNVLSWQEPGLIGISTQPNFAIGQRPLLVRTSKGNVLWDCMAPLDQDTIHLVQEMGGIEAITISHPHYYTTMVEWAEAFDATIYLHEDDRQWVTRGSEQMVFWTGETLPLVDGITVLRVGGHFAASTVLHWRDGAEGRGVLLTGDSIYVVADHNWVSFMYSYPNDIPLHPNKVRHIQETVRPYAFDRLYGAWTHSIVPKDAHAVVMRSAERYIRAITGE